MRLAREDGLGLDPLEKAGPTPEVKPLEVSLPAPSRASVLQELIQQAMIGTLPTRRPLGPDDPKSLHTTHIAMIYDSVNGASAAEIAARYNYKVGMVYRVLNHPFTEVLEAALMGRMADDLTDPLERMRAYSHEAIDTKVQIMRDPSTPKSLRNAVASDFLDRVGYGARKTVQIEDNRDTKNAVPAPMMERFVNALEKANEVKQLGFGGFVKTGEGGSAGKAVSAGEGGALPSTSADSGGASPVGGPRSQTSQKEKVA